MLPYFSFINRIQWRESASQSTDKSFTEITKTSINLLCNILFFLTIL